MAAYKININTLTIGSKIFAVHSKYAFKKVIGGKVMQARVTSFTNRNGNIEVDFRLVGQPKASGDLSMEYYTIFTDIKKAINSIKS
jgi:hypothetical protein